MQGSTTVAPITRGDIGAVSFETSAPSEEKHVGIKFFLVKRT